MNLYKSTYLVSKYGVLGALTCHPIYSRFMCLYPEIFAGLSVARAAVTARVREVGGKTFSSPPAVKHEVSLIRHFDFKQNLRLVFLQDLRWKQKARDNLVNTQLGNLKVKRHLGLLCFDPLLLTVPPFMVRVL